MSAESANRCDVVVIGAGVAGLCAAVELAAVGHAVVLLDKGRGVGGRMATRRLGDAVLDHGAQFFTVRGRAFGGLVAGAHEAGRVATWCEGFARAEAVAAPAMAAGDGHARWRGVQGMTDLPKFLAGGLIDRGATVRTNARVTAVGVAAGHVRLEVDGGPPLAARGCVVTAPVPQALDLLAAGGLLASAGVRIDEAAHRRLATIAYDPCFALMLVLDRPGRVPEPGRSWRAAYPRPA